MKKIIALILLISGAAYLEASGAYRQAASRGTQALRTQMQQQARNFATRSPKGNELIIHPSRTQQSWWTDLKARAREVEQSSKEYLNDSKRYMSDLRKALFGAVAVTTAGKLASDQVETYKLNLKKSHDLGDVEDRLRIQKTSSAVIKTYEREILNEMQELRKDLREGQISRIDFEIKRNELWDKLKLSDKKQEETQIKIQELLRQKDLLKMQ